MDGPVRRSSTERIEPAFVRRTSSSRSRAAGYRCLVTHLFQKSDEYIDNNVVYGVKDPLIVEFVKKPPGRALNGDLIDTPFYEVKYDFVLGPKQPALAAAEERASALWRATSRDSLEKTNSSWNLTTAQPTQSKGCGP